MKGIDLCCCSGAGMRFLARFRNVASMVGVDATAKVVELGRQRCRDEGCRPHPLCPGRRVRQRAARRQRRLRVGEDAWCYVEDKDKLVSEAARLVKPGGRHRLHRLGHRPAGLTDAEAERI